jgi:hypothetical protein
LPEKKPSAHKTRRLVAAELRGLSPTSSGGRATHEIATMQKSIYIYISRAKKNEKQWRPFFKCEREMDRRKQALLETDTECEKISQLSTYRVSIFSDKKQQQQSALDIAPIIL